ncbi:hypothetical protein ACOME3_008517 [Neoechinorhynchus agilis]
MSRFRSNEDSGHFSLMDSLPRDPPDYRGRKALKVSKKPISLKINLTSANKKQVIAALRNIQQESTDEAGKENKELKYINLSTRKWPYSISLKANPIPPRDTLQKRFLISCLKSNKNEKYRIRSISYFGGALKVQFASGEILMEYGKVLQMSGLSPDIDQEDRNKFEKRFGCAILFFLKGQKKQQTNTESSSQSTRGRAELSNQKRMLFQQTTIIFPDAAFAKYGALGSKLPVKKNDISCSAFRDYLTWARIKEASDNFRIVVPPKPPKPKVFKSTSTGNKNLNSSWRPSSSQSLNDKLNEFSEKILNLVDLRISNAIKDLESRLAARFSYLMEAINVRLDNIKPVSLCLDPARSKGRIVMSPISINIEEAEMDEMEDYVREVIDKQTEVCARGIHKLIQKRDLICNEPKTGAMELRGTLSNSSFDHSDLFIRHSFRCSLDNCTIFITAPATDSSQGLLSVFKRTLNPQRLSQFTTPDLSYDVFLFCLFERNLIACNIYIRPRKIHLPKSKELMRYLLNPGVDFAFGDFNDPSQKWPSASAQIASYDNFGHDLMVWNLERNQLLFLNLFCCGNINASLGEINEFLVVFSDRFLSTVTRTNSFIRRPKLLSLFGRQLMVAKSYEDTASAQFWGSLYWPCRARFQLNIDKKCVGSLVLNSSPWWRTVSQQAGGGWIMEAS